MASCLIVENEAAERDFLARCLSEDGHSVQFCNDGEDSLALLSGPGMQVDVLVLSWRANSSMSGSELLARLLQTKIRAKRIVLSEVATLDVRNRAVALGACDLLMKPVDGERLKRAIRLAIADPRETNPLVQELRTELIGDSDAFLDAVVKLARAIEEVNKEQTTVLLTGENGCGKELFAQALHHHTRAQVGCMEAINLAGLSKTLLESELFGHEKGSFTGADRRHCGAFERAGKGTLFLDEIGYLDLDLQPKLLRAIQERKFMRVGGNEVFEVDAQLVSATNRNLAAEVACSRYQGDLYHRLSGFEIRIPPLRERKDDLKPLIGHFLRNTGCVLEADAWDTLNSYSFPGNVRELEHVLKQARAVCREGRIRAVDLPGEILADREAEPGKSDEWRWPSDLFSKGYEVAAQEVRLEFDRKYLRQKLEGAGGNKSRAARNIGVATKTLLRKLRECGLEQGHIATGEESTE